jgi:CRP/FNR family transcriptional regulator, cyclic AMP receptor protein
MAKEDYIDRIVSAKDSISIFKGMSDEEVHNVIKDINFLTFDRGEYIIKSGETGKDVYLLIKGQCNVIVNNKSVAVIHEQQTFGEISLITNQQRDASIVASTQCTVISFNLDMDLIEKSITGYAVIYKNLVNEIVQKLEATNQHR